MNLILVDFSLGVNNPQATYIYSKLGDFLGLNLVDQHFFQKTCLGCSIVFFTLVDQQLFFKKHVQKPIIIM